MVMRLVVYGDNKVVKFNPDKALAIEQKVVNNQLIKIYHYQTFKVVIVSEAGVVKSVNVIDRETCNCVCE
jgi:hypothetical protein